MEQALIDHLEAYPPCPELQTAIECIRKNDPDGFIQAIRSAPSIPELFRDTLITSVEANFGLVDLEKAHLKTLDELRKKITDPVHLKIIDNLESLVYLPDESEVAEIPALDDLLDAYPDEDWAAVIAYVGNQLSFSEE